MFSDFSCFITSRSGQFINDDVTLLVFFDTVELRNKIELVITESHYFSEGGISASKCAVETQPCLRGRARGRGRIFEWRILDVNLQAGVTNRHKLSRPQWNVWQQLVVPETNTTGSEKDSRVWAEREKDKGSV